MHSLLQRGRALLLVAALGACAPDAAPEPEAPDAAFEQPLLLLAVDGLDWSVLLPLVRAGEVPAIAGLMARGSFGTLRSIQPSSSPVIWTSIATGKGPREHGITGFVYAHPTPDGDEPRVFTSGHRRTKAFWNVFSDARLPVDVIGWWVTYPAESVRGLMVSQTNTTAGLQQGAQLELLKGSLQEGVERQVWPPEREARVLAELAGVDAALGEIVARHFGVFESPLGELEERLWNESAWSIRADETYLRIALAHLADGPPAALTALYLGTPDVIGHRFWRHAHPEQFELPPDPAQVELCGDLLEASYRRVDTALAELLARLPADARVLLVSDHGMHAVNTGGRYGADEGPAGRLSGHHLDSPPGVLIAAGPGLRARGATLDELRALELDDLERVGSVLDVLPTLLTLYGLPVGRDMDGRAMLDLFDPPIEAPAAIPTHDSAAWLEAHEAFRVDNRDLEERLEQLRRLGYVR